MSQQVERPDAVVTTEVVVLTVRGGRLHVLLTDPDGGRAGAWTLPGGRKAADHSLDETAALAVPGLDPSHREQLGTYGDPARDERGHVVSVAYLALTPDARPNVTAERYWAVDDLRDGFGPPLARDHGRILDDAVERARAKLEYTTLATRLVPDPFTVGDLFEVYRAVWGAEPGDKANFARKVKRTPGFVVAVDRAAPTTGRGRPSTLFTAGAATGLHPPILRPARATRSASGP